MIPLSNKFAYPTLTRVEMGDQRRYDVNGCLVKSVTTILSETEDHSYIDSWRESIGNEEADKIVAQSSGTGTQMHSSLENYIRHGSRPAGNYFSRMLAQMIIDGGLKHVSEVWGIECNLYYPDLYAGTADLIGIYRGRPAIIDFKNSRREKTLQDITSYRAQGAAYALAHNYMFDTDISTIVIMMGCHSGKYLEFDITGTEFDESAEMWLSKLHQSVSKS